MSNGSLTRFDYAIQAAYDDIPDPSDAWAKFRYNGGSPTRSTVTEEDPEIGGDTASVTSEGPATGTMDVSLWYGQLDPFMEMLFGSDFASDVLTPGEVIKYMTMQEHQPDLLSGDKFTQFVNTAITSLTLTLPTPNGRITGQLGVSASNGDSSATSIAAASPSVNTAPLMRTGSLVSNLRIDDQPISAFNTRISQLVLGFTRGTEDEPQIDADGRGAISFGDLTATLAFTGYDEDRTLINTLFANQSRKIELSIRDANGKGYDFLYAAASPNGGQPSPAAKNTKRTQTFNYSTTNPQITRIP